MSTLKISSTLALIAATATLAGPAVTAPAQAATPAAMGTMAVRAPAVSTISLTHLNAAGLKAERARTTDMAKSAILDAALKNMGGNAASDFSLSFSLSWMPQGTPAAQ